MKKVAHQPHMNIKMGEKLITPRTYQEGMAKMLHFIDAAKNHSKFYEMAIIPGDNGGFKLIKMYGALTDPNTTARKPPRISTLVENHPTLASAIKSMEKKYREELRDGYTDTFLKNRGQYPIGLTRTVGFGWGTQDATESSDAIPALRKLIVKLDAAIDAGDRMDTDDMSVSMAEVSRILFDLPNSSMATELQRRLSTPAKQLLGGEVNPKLLVRALKNARNYLDNQLSAIGRMASERSALVKLAASLPAGSPERKVILNSLAAEIKKDADPKSHNQNKPETYYGKTAYSLNGKIRIDGDAVTVTYPEAKDPQVYSRHIISHKNNPLVKRLALDALSILRNKGTQNLNWEEVSSFVDAHVAKMSAGRRGGRSFVIWNTAHYPD